MPPASPNKQAPTPPALPAPLIITEARGPRVAFGGRSLIRFGGCNYLAMNQEPAVRSAARDALDRLGLSASASRTTTGDTAEHRACEAALARFTGFERACLLPDGYTANIAAMQALSPSVELVVLDERAHHSLKDAAACAGLPCITYPHANARAAAQIVRDAARPVCIATDTLFAADAACAPLQELQQIANSAPPGSVLLGDECHAFAGLGPTGRGRLAALGLIPTRTIATLTLSKGLGCGGGAVLAPTDLESALRAARVYVGTTPVSPILAAASGAAIDLLGEHREYMRDLGERSAQLHASLKTRHDAQDTPPFLAIPVDPHRGVRVHAALLHAGFEAPLIAYPGGPGSAYFRIAVSRLHTPADIGRFASTFTRAMTEHA